MITQSFQIDSLSDIAEKVQCFQLENVKPCQYHNIDNVYNLISNNDKLFLLHLNIQSLQKHFDSPKELLHQLLTPPDVICITESKLKDGFSCTVSIPDYSFFHANSPTNNIPINITSTAKYLGIEIDSNLSFTNQINKIKAKISTALVIRFLLEHFAPKQILISVYYSLVFPHLCYGIIVLGSTSNNRVQQNKYLQVIDGWQFKQKIKPLYEKYI